MNKRSSIGLKRADLLCQLNQDERLAFLAEGLPGILSSAIGLWKASRQIVSMPREAEVLSGHAEEEAAKILMIMDIVRCPKKLIASKIGKMTGWFYDHLARLIYADAVSWRAQDLNQLREYVNNSRESHYLEGEFGQYILPNHELSMRESTLYADIAAYEDGKPVWSFPRGLSDSFPEFLPPALSLTQSFAALGLFRLEGLRATSEVWSSVEFKATEGYSESERLTKELLQRIADQNLPSATAKNEDVRRLYNWQIPMYNLDFTPLHISLDELKKQREVNFYAEIRCDQNYF